MLCRPLKDRISTNLASTTVTAKDELEGGSLLSFRHVDVACGLSLYLLSGARADRI